MQEGVEIRSLQKHSITDVALISAAGLGPAVFDAMELYGHQMPERMVACLKIRQLLIKIPNPPFRNLHQPHLIRSIHPKLNATGVESSHRYA